MIILQVLLTILKIIGIILLVVLGIILLTLFFPISYKGCGEMEKNIGRGYITVFWLFHFIHFRIWFVGSKTKYSCRILGKKIFSSDKEPKQKKHSKKTTSKNKNNTDKEELAPKLSIEKEPLISKLEIEDDEQPIEEQINEEQNKNVNSDEIPIQETKDNVFNKIVKIVTKLKNIFIKIKNGIRKAVKNLQKTYDSAKEWIQFLKAETTKEAYRYGKNKLKHILKQLLPRSIKGELTMGFESPDITGKLLGIIAIAISTFKINSKKIIINPDLEKPVFNGKIQIRGHFMAGVIGIYCLQFYFKKEIHDIINKFK